MHLVVDANILLAALLRDSTTRRLILDPHLHLYAPEHLLTETERHLVKSDRFRRRLGLNKRELTVLFMSLTADISVVPETEYVLKRTLSRRLAPHPEDAPYLALAIHLRIPLWSNDAGMRNQQRVVVITTTELVKIV